LELLTSQEIIERCEGALGSVQLCERIENNAELLKALAEILQRIGTALSPLLFSDSWAEISAADWALYQLGRCKVWEPPAEPDVMGRLFTLWRSQDSYLQRVVPSTITAQRLVTRRDVRPCSTIQPDEFKTFIRNYSEMNSPVEKRATLLIAWYLGVPWSNAELIELARPFSEGAASEAVISMRALLEQLGEKPDPIPPVGN
jgi:hypothetical protein